MLLSHAYRHFSEPKRWVYEETPGEALPDPVAPSEESLPAVPMEDQEAAEEAQAAENFNFDVDFEVNFKGLDRRMRESTDREVPTEYDSHVFEVHLDEVLRELNLDGDPKNLSLQEQQVIQAMTQALADFDAVMEQNWAAERLEYAASSKRVARLQSWIEKQYTRVEEQAKMRIQQANIEDSTPEVQQKARLELVEKYLAEDPLSQLVLQEDPGLLDGVFDPLPQNEGELKQRLFQAIERRDIKDIVKRHKENNPSLKSQADFHEDQRYFSKQIQKSIDGIQNKDPSTAFIYGVGNKNAEKMAKLLAREYNVVEEGEKSYVQNAEGKTWTLEYFETQVLPEVCKAQYGSIQALREKRREIRKEERRAAKVYNELMGIPLVGLWSERDMARPRNLKDNATLQTFLEKALQRNKNTEHPIATLEDEEHYGGMVGGADTTQQADVVSSGEVTPDLSPEAMAEQFWKGYEGSDLQKLIDLVAHLFKISKDSNLDPVDREKSDEELGEMEEAKDHWQDTPAEERVELSVEKDRAKAAYLEQIKIQKPTLAELMEGAQSASARFDLPKPPESASAQEKNAFEGVDIFSSQKLEAMKQYLQENVKLGEWQVDRVDARGIKFNKGDQELTLTQVEQEVSPKLGVVYRFRNEKGEHVDPRKNEAQMPAALDHLGGALEYASTTLLGKNPSETQPLEK